jgi:hypothetical protein
MTMFIVRGFSSSQHPAGFGKLLLETAHTTEASASIEIDAWKARIQRNEASRVELIDCRVGGTLTDLNIQPYTYIPWPWRKRA